MLGKMKRRLTAGLVLLVLLLTGCAVQNDAAVTPELQNGPVSYLGPEGTYTQEAARCFFGMERELLPQKTVADAVQQLLDGSCVYAVIPQENTLGGPVYDYLDELLAHDNLSIVGEIELPIRQALLAAEGTALQDITVVYSHQQGIVQGKAWLEQNLPEAEVVEVSSTAEGARMVAESDSADCAAVASTGAAEVYGLQVLAESIQRNESNQTRFYVLSTKAPVEAAGDRMVFTAIGEAEELPELLTNIEKKGLRLVSIHDRPEKTELGSYIYLIECEACGYREFRDITEHSEFEVRYYGAFPVR